MSCHSSHAGVAATGYAKAITDLDDSQVSSIFHRLKREAGDVPAPGKAEAVSELTALRRDIADDPRLDDAARGRLVARLDKAIAAAETGDVPDGRTWVAMREMQAEAEFAQVRLDHLLRESARAQRIDPDRLAAKFRLWRRTDNYEDIESPDPQFRPDPRNYPGDKHTARALRKLGFESYLAQPLPVFVYGTLRQGQHNSHLMTGAIEGAPVTARVDGVGIHGAEWGFPYAVEHEGAYTVGDLVHLEDSWKGDGARRSLDRLEGFNSDAMSSSHYRRVIREVTYPDPETGEIRTVQAWTYLAGSYAARDLSARTLIEDGDWVRARQASRRGSEYRGSVAADTEDAGFDGEITIKKRAVDPTPPARSAADAAAAFEALGVFDEEPAEDAGFWSTVAP